MDERRQQKKKEVNKLLVILGRSVEMQGRDGEGEEEKEGLGHEEK